jgi:hypothetical protein
MKINVLEKELFDDKLGRLVKNQIVEVIDHKAKFYIERGLAESYETKVMRDRPSLVVGKQLSALPVAPVLQSQTLNQLENGEKKKRKQKKALL